MNTVQNSAAPAVVSQEWALLPQQGRQRF